LSDGILNGELKIYHKSGSLFKQSFFINGKNTGTEISYFQSGKVRGRMKYEAGKSSRSQQFFPNGQLAYDYLDDGLDTLVSYYSTGKIKKIDIRKNGVVAKNPITEQINYYQNFVYQSSREGDFKTGLKYCNKILQLDSVNETAYFYKGEFLEKQNRLEEAIIQYDKAISIEPLLHYALIKRAFARIKKYESGGSTNTVIASGTNPFIPANEVEKICADLQLAVYCDVSEKRIADALVKYCRIKSSR
jgi:antitoxin component YwqK of YwqJK toxin-antitoxin module